MPIAVDKQQLIHAADARERFATEREIIHRFTGGEVTELAVCLVTPAGDSLTDKNIFRMQDVTELLTTLRDVVRRFGPVAPRTVVPDWQDSDKGVGLTPDGGVRLALVVRYTDRHDYTARPVFDSIPLNERQWRELCAADAAIGESKLLPLDLAHAFSRAVSAQSDLAFLIRPEDVTQARFVATPRRATNGTREVQLHGTMTAARKHVNGPEILPGQCSFEGLIETDSGSLPLRLLMVFNGTFRMPWDESNRPVAAYVEWRARRPVANE